MKFSVIIPAYNVAKTIGLTLDSVLAQSVAPHEILVFDDGSTDNTAAILESYKSRVTVYRQSNQGAAHARNFLCAQAQGDILAFLDGDDLWHPYYLEIQQRLIEMFPHVVAYFTWHADFIGNGSYSFSNDLPLPKLDANILDSEAFLAEYNRNPMKFQMSGFCMPSRVLSQIEGNPFCVAGGEDTYLHTMLPLLGSVAHTSLRLVAYRILDSSLSNNQVKCSLAIVAALEKLESLYRKSNKSELYRAFRDVNASRIRCCGKFLMGAKQAAEARSQFRRAATASRNPISIMKSFGLYCSTMLPRTLQPRWPESRRMFRDCTFETNTVQQ
jgi:glycosyltransferase involved in cell wall biosynthesis